MSGLYDQLLNHLDDDDNDTPAGLTPLDIADLPHGQRQVMFTMLRDPEAAVDGLTLDALQRKLAHVDGLLDILEELTRQGWLILRGESAAARYKINLKRRRSREATANVWASLTEHLSGATDSDQGGPDEDAGSNTGSRRLPRVSDW